MTEKLQAESSEDCNAESLFLLKLHLHFCQDLGFRTTVIVLVRRLAGLLRALSASLARQVLRQGACSWRVRGGGGGGECMIPQ